MTRPLFRLACAGWLLFAAAASGEVLRTSPMSVPEEGRTGFTQLDGSITGIRFTNSLSLDRSITNQVYLNGSGVAAGDVDGDGLCDLYFCGLDGPNALFRNLGNWKFEERAAAAGVACADQASTGAALVDLDGDGDQDLIVTTIGGGTLTFLNDGQGNFTRLPNPDPEANRAGSMSLALADVDGDGDLDLYVTNYRTTTLRDEPLTRFRVNEINGRNVIVQVDGRPMTDPDVKGRFELGPRGDIKENGEPDAFFLNDGTGVFRRVPFGQGAFLDEEGGPVAIPYDWGLSVMFRDLNGDGAPDAYVCNDFDSPDRIWMNDGRGRFRALPLPAIRKTSLFSMGIDFADIDRDGHDDFIVLDMLSHDPVLRKVQVGEIRHSMLPPGGLDDRPQYPRNTVFLNRGDGTYAEMACLAGLQASEWSWSAAFLDVDLDGYEDMLITNGHERDALNIDIARRLDQQRAGRTMSRTEILDARRQFPRLDTANLAFRNRGDLTFEDRSREWGFDLRGVSHGLALADLDNDGDLDGVINNLNGPALVLRNETIAPRILVRLSGSDGNTRGIGARISVTGGSLTQTQEIMAGGRYLSSDDPCRVFAVPRPDAPVTIEVKWRDGTRTVVADALANHAYVIRQPEDARDGLNTLRKPGEERVQPLFEEVSDWLNHAHRATEFDDLARQPGLPYRLSRPGPGVAWVDLDGDGWDDLIVTAGGGGHAGVFMNQAGTGFKPHEETASFASSGGEQTAAVGVASSDGSAALIIGISNYEIGTAMKPASLVSKGAAGWELEIPDQAFTAGPLALADVDEDGNLDLFIGGRCLPGRFPEPAPSLLLRNENGRFRPDVENAAVFERVGMVQGAVFSDIDGDGDPDLIVACDWGPVRLFINEGGRFTEQTDRFGLDEFRGMWNGVATGDFDGDGRMDIVASNQGRNSMLESHRERPVRLYHADLNRDGRVEVLMAWYEASMSNWIPVHGFDAVAAVLPPVRSQFATYEGFGRANIGEVLGPWLPLTQVEEMSVVESSIFLNRGDRFERRPLPVEAQLAPGFGIAVGDLDGDGHEDLFLSQNFFATRPEVPRYDAGRGLLLLGDGRGNFRAMPGQRSGLRIYGEQRGCALSDFNADGRLDLVVGQNAAATKLYRNVGATPGLRVRLQGGRQNPDAVDAQLRPIYENGDRGAAREIQAGSGYWSQNSTVQVFGQANSIARIAVRWPQQGEMTEYEIPSGALEVVLKPTGGIEVIR